MQRGDPTGNGAPQGQFTSNHTHKTINDSIVLPYVKLITPFSSVTLYYLFEN